MQTLHKVSLGVKKIKLQLDDDETSVYGKLISGEKDDVSDVKGFPQLHKGGGFEMLHCLPNCLNPNPPKEFLVHHEIDMQHMRPVKDLSQTSCDPIWENRA